ncbi:glycosyltransferase [Paenibacillus sp. MBLB4367]|uniref:glycosyltransferase n=1 Tax=Paenibacillus sp. MBLB4367 TaxID=3384767 RepID=UPI0039081BD9
MKKILLLGEYSGVHTNLKEGLQEIGYDVTIASGGDGKKKFKGDIDISLVGKFKISKFVHLKRILNSFAGYDLVQFINPYISHKLGVLMYKHIYENNGPSFCLAAGDDVEFTRFTQNRGFSKYSPFDYELENNIELPYSSIFDIYLHNKFMKNIKGIIPIMYEYAESYRSSVYKNKLKNTIAMPINLSSIKYTENRISNGKLKIYHGELRPLFKGTPYIKEAMGIIKSKYPNDVDILHAGILPLQQYLDIIKDTNVIMDQCRSYSYGMNAVYSMAQGKIVMSGSEKESLEEFGESSCPIINIEPSTQQIVKQLELLIENRYRITELGEHSRKYVELKHSHIKIAKEYEESWELKG